MNKGLVLAALSGLLFSAGANALLIEGSFSATSASIYAPASEITGNIFIDYEPSRVTEASPGVYHNGDSSINWIDITINELTMPLLSTAQAPELADRLVLVDSSSATGDRLELIDKASDTTAINTKELRRIELDFQLANFDFLAGENINQLFALDWTSSSGDGTGQLKIFHRTVFGASIGTQTSYSLTSLQFGTSASRPITSVPEPSSLLLLGMGLGAFGLRRHQKSRKI